jgi:hypothetical protein
MKSSTSRCSSSRKYHAQARAGRLRHLPVDQRATRFFRIARDNNARLLELEPQVVSFSRALADAGEHGNTAVLHRDVVDQFLNQHGLAHARAAEQSDLAALQVRFEQIHDLDARLEHFQSCGLVFQGWRRPVNRIALVGLHGSQTIHRLAYHIEHATQRSAADGHRDRLAQIFRLHAADQSFRRLHRHAADAAFAQMLLHFRDDIERLGNVESLALNAHRIVNPRQVALFKLHVHHRADHFGHVADFVLVRCHSGVLLSLPNIL